MTTKVRKSAKEKEERVAVAKEAVDTMQSSLRVAEERFDVPKSTIHDHVTGRSIQESWSRKPPSSDHRRGEEYCEVLSGARPVRVWDRPHHSGQGSS